jgi:hypothetical protein
LGHIRETPTFRKRDRVRQNRLFAGSFEADARTRTGDPFITREETPLLGRLVLTHLPLLMACFDESSDEHE